MASEKTVVDKIYEKFADLRKEATEDCKFDRGHIEDSYDNTTKVIKWINKKSDWAKAFRSYEKERKDVYRKTYEFYVSDFPMKLNGKDEYQLFIESDPAYLDVYTRCQIVKEILVYIDSVIDTLKARAWEVKGCLDYLRFSNGLN
jgi:hypothetical protein